MFSKTASMIKSLLLSSFISMVAEKRFIICCFWSDVILPNLTFLSYVEFIFSKALSIAPWFCSIIITLYPAFIAAMEIPVPIVPPPITPIFLSSTGLPFANSGIFVMALSEKNEWIKPSLWVLLIHSLNNLLSFFIASGKSRLRPSSTDVIIAWGENRFLYFFNASDLNLFITLFISSIFLILSSILEVGLIFAPSFINFLAYAIPLSILLLSWAISSTIPFSKASLTGTCFPVNIISKAIETPQSLGNLCVPPAPGKIPNKTSGNPTLVFGAAIL